MNDDNIQYIIDLCTTINHRALEIYIKLSLAGGDDELKRFWMEMADEEKLHAAFWANVQRIAKEYDLPHVFGNPSDMAKELENVLQKVEILSKRWESDQNMENAFILAYRLEYYMLHPAIETLYHTLKPFAGEADPEDTYDRHINRFIEMLVQYGDVTPELELLGETLQSLWQRNKILTKLVMIDSLTGLLNRKGFFIMARELSYLAQRNKKNMGILMIDIDNFKNINDRYGHPKGDKVLKRVAKTLETSVRKSDILGRFGGEEFIILFPAIRPAALRCIAEKIRSDVEKTRPEGILVTISIGVAQGVIQADPDTQIFAWITKADERLYQAKADGRNCVVSGP
jgi:diguanylate cyclase (GGDEF)-like protein